MPPAYYVSSCRLVRGGWSSLIFLSPSVDNDNLSLWRMFQPSPFNSDGGRPRGAGSFVVKKKSVLLLLSIWELTEVLETPVTLAVLADASVEAAAVDVKSVIYTADNVASSADVSTCAAPGEELRASGLRVGAPRARR
jgi:hypothetical protein